MKALAGRGRHGAAAAKREHTLGVIRATAAKESMKVEMASKRLAAEAEAKAAKLAEKLENAEVRKAEIYGFGGCRPAACSRGVGGA